MNTFRVIRTKQSNICRLNERIEFCHFFQYEINFKNKNISGNKTKKIAYNAIVGFEATKFPAFQD